MQSELLRRTLSECEICPKTLEYIRDVFENLIECAGLAQMLKDSLLTGQVTLKLCEERMARQGVTNLGFDAFHKVLQSHGIVKDEVVK